MVYPWNWPTKYEYRLDVTDLLPDPLHRDIVKRTFADVGPCPRKDLISELMQDAADFPTWRPTLSSIAAELLALSDEHYELLVKWLAPKKNAGD